MKATTILAIGTVAMFSATTFAQQPIEYKVSVKAEAVKGSPNDHYLTFNVPVAVPDATLPAGTYVFTRLHSSIVQIRSADRSEQLAMFFAIPVARADATASDVVTLAPAERGVPRRITAWFTPDTELGLQFLYAPAEAAGER